MSFMPEEDRGPFTCILEDKQLMPPGLWLVVKVFVMDTDHEFHRLRILWERSGRKSARVMRLKPIVLPVRPHKVEPVVCEDWVMGVIHKESYGILLDIDHHGLRGADDYKLSFQIQKIEVLDLLATSMAEERS